MIWSHTGHHTLNGCISQFVSLSPLVPTQILGLTETLQTFLCQACVSLSWNKMTSTRIPALLSPYLAFPEEASLVLLSGVLGASTNWLVLRFLAAALATCEQGHATHDGDPETVVVTLSFLREWTFWRVEAGRVVSDSYWINGLGFTFPGFKIYQKWR